MKKLNTKTLKDIYEANGFLYEEFDWGDVITCLVKATEDTFQQDNTFVVSGEYTTLVVNKTEIVVIPTEASLNIIKTTKENIIKKYGKAHYDNLKANKIDKTQPFLIKLETPINFEALKGGR